MSKTIFKKGLLAFAILLVNYSLSFSASNKYQQSIELDEIEKKNVYDIMALYIEDMCIKEVPFFIALHRCYHQDKRLPKGYKLLIDKYTVLQLKKQATSLHNMDELNGSSIYRLDSLILYKKKANRYKKNLCNFIAYVDPGAYEVPKTGAKLIVPGVIKGSIYYNKNNKNKKMVVYFHVGGIKLELPGYAKTLSLGLLTDMDIGIAEVEFTKGNWISRLIYVKKNKNEKIQKGWSFNIGKCNKITPYLK